MSDDIEKLKSENLQLNNALKAFSGQLRATKQISDDFYQSIVNIKSSHILIEDQLKLSESLLNEAKNKVKSLEEENAELKKKLELLPVA